MPVGILPPFPPTETPVHETVSAETGTEPQFVSVDELEFTDMDHALSFATLVTVITTEAVADAVESGLDEEKVIVPGDAMIEAIDGARYGTTSGGGCGDGGGTSHK